MRIKSLKVVSFIVGILGIAATVGKAETGCKVIDCVVDAHNTVAQAVLSCCGKEGSTSREIASYMCMKGPVKIISGITHVVVTLCQSAAAAPPGGVCIPCSDPTCKGACQLICKPSCPPKS